MKHWMYYTARDGPAYLDQRDMNELSDSLEWGPIEDNAVDRMAVGDIITEGQYHDFWFLIRIPYLPEDIE